MPAVDLHTHTCYSRWDGMLSPAGLLDAAVAAGLDAIAVTDHYTYEGALEGALAARQLARGREVDVFLGLEYHVEVGEHRGHVLVYLQAADQAPELGLTLGQLVDHARDHGLTLGHAHPHGFRGIPHRPLMRAADLVELNGCYGTGPANRRVRAAAREEGLEHKLVASSDAHAASRLGTAYTEVERLAPTVADTLSTVRSRVVGDGGPVRARVAKVARTVAQPVGWAVNAVQRWATRRALARRVRDVDGPAPREGPGPAGRPRLPD